MHKKRILVQSNGSGPQCRLFLTFCWRWKTRQQIAVLSLDVRPWPGQDQSKKEPVSWSNMSFCEVAKTSTDWWWQLNWEISQPMWRNHSQHINISNWSTCTNPSSCVCDYTSAASEFQVESYMHFASETNARHLYRNVNYCQFSSLLKDDVFFGRQDKLFYF